MRDLVNFDNTSFSRIIRQTALALWFFALLSGCANQPVPPPASGPSLPELIKEAMRGLDEMGHGWTYLKGEKVDRDLTIAAKHFRKAAELGMPLAFPVLAKVYAEGQGVAPDLIEAQKWVELTRKAGLRVNPDPGKEFAEKLSEADKARARRLAEEFWATHRNRLWLMITGRK